MILAWNNWSKVDIQDDWLVVFSAFAVQSIVRYIYLLCIVASETWGQCIMRAHLKWVNKHVSNVEWIVCRRKSKCNLMRVYSLTVSPIWVLKHYISLLEHNLRDICFVSELLCQMDLSCAFHSYADLEASNDVPQCRKYHWFLLSTYRSVILRSPHHLWVAYSRLPTPWCVKTSVLNA